MDILSSQFLSALSAIVVIDLVLAGDNAIVIALAARNLPQHLRRRAIVWGTLGAIAVRSALTMAVVWLLKLPGLLFAGGALLVWIAWRLLVPEEESDATESHGNGAASFWAAMRTVIVADALMGLDNVLAVAGAAHGSYLLVVLGLLISVPIVIWGSTLVLQWVERFPAIVYLGAGVLAWTAAKMIAAEPFLKDAFAETDLAAPLLALLLVAGVVWGGFVRNHRRLESRIHARLARFTGRGLAEARNAFTEEGTDAMLRILLPTDGSRNAGFAARHVVQEFLKSSDMEVHLLNVQAPFSRHIAAFASKKSRDAFHRDRAAKALAPAREILDAHRVPYVVHVELGDKARVIAEAARRLRCHHIVMATARKNSLTRMLEDSVTNRVLELTRVPVELIAGDDISKAERYGVPAGIGALIAVLLFAALD